ncbi:MAG TPA: glycoside hydrolase family 172 protein [Phycisphaerae bacterium]|nr:glycoside hydrolase family 172 protein [Phycisphaerae bacterium]
MSLWLEAARTPPGISRQATTFNPKTRDKTVLLPIGRRVTVAEAAGAGYIGRLWLTFPGWFWRNWDPAAEVAPTVFKALIMRIYWDGQPTPAVEVPVGDFFGAGHCEFNSFTSRFVGTSSGGFFSYWPMPFAKGFRIEFENRHPRIVPDIFVNVSYQELPEAPAGTGYFCAQYHTARRQGIEEAVVLEAEGRGHLAGVMLSMQGEPLNYFRYLEAPEYVFIDDDWESPRIVGTGLEDYFNGGWYFREGEFAGPVHGVPLRDPLRSMVTMYRFHTADAIAFERRIRMAFINPRPASELHPYWYASTAYWYGRSPTPAQPSLPAHAEVSNLYRTRDRDHQAIP